MRLSCRWFIVDSCMDLLHSNWCHSSDTTLCSIDCWNKICCSKFAPDMDTSTWCADTASQQSRDFSRGTPMKYVYTPVMTYLMVLVHFHYCISASPSKLFALHLHAISHVYTPPVFPCYYWTVHATHLMSAWVVKSPRLTVTLTFYDLEMITSSCIIDSYICFVIDKFVMVDCYLDTVHRMPVNQTRNTHIVTGL